MFRGVASENIPDGNILAETNLLTDHNKSDGGRGWDFLSLLLPGAGGFILGSSPCWLHEFFLTGGILLYMTQS